MTIDWDKPIETTDGRPARVLATDLPGEFPLAIAWESLNDRWSSNSYNEAIALVRFRNKRTKREGWVNVYANTRTQWGSIYPTREEADRAADDDRADCVKIEWNEP